jgi:3-hydroxy acid dehydrogenase / malonic semialdehyde reductase
MKQIAIVTGATAGFGEAIARILAMNGYGLVITGRRADRLEKLKNELLAYTENITSLCFDVREEEQVNEAFGSLSQEIRGGIGLLVNNAGLAVGRGPIDTGLTEDWNRMLDTNVKGLLYVSKAVIPVLKENNGGHIVNIASIAGKEVYAGGNVYCASKHAVDALSKAMRIDLLPYGIRVTNIAPGAAETEFSIVRFKGDESVAKSVYEGFDPLIAQDIAESVLFAVTRPPHVNINDLVIMPSAQATSTIIRKRSEL